GLLRFDGVRTVAWQPPEGHALPSTDIWSVLGTRDGALWIGTSKGLVQWKGGVLKEYPELAGEFIMALAEARDGTVWAGGAAVPSGRVCEIRDGHADCSGQDGGFGYGVFGLYPDSKGNLWIGGLGGVWRGRHDPPLVVPGMDPREAIGG